MTREQYFEMCEMLHSEPVEEEIPVELSDLHDEVQEAIIVYNMLQDNWDSMNGIFLGKVYTGVHDIMKIMGVEDERTCLYILRIIDQHRSKVLNSKRKPAK